MSIRDWEAQNPGLKGLASAGLLAASGAVVFGAQRLAHLRQGFLCGAQEAVVAAAQLDLPSRVDPTEGPAIRGPVPGAEAGGGQKGVGAAADRVRRPPCPGKLVERRVLWQAQAQGEHAVGAFWLSIAGTIAAFQPVSPVAAALMVPTQLWVTVAAKLNWDIVRLNPDKKAA